MKLLTKSIDALYQAIEISPTVLETNIILGRRNCCAPKHDDAVAYLATAFVLGRDLQNQWKSILEIRLYCDELPLELQTWQEMLKLPEVHQEGFIKAGYAAIYSLMEMDTFEKVHWEEAMKQDELELLGTKWVFTVQA